MKKRYKWEIFLAFIALIVIPISAFYNKIVVDLDELEEGEFLPEYLSPNGNYKAIAYLLKGGASTRDAIRVEIDFGNDVKTIYWNYDERTVNTKWENKEIVEINGRQLKLILVKLILSISYF